jgi:hypothetical protein
VPQFTVQLPTIEQLRTYVERAKERRPELTSRLERAAFIVTMRTITRHGPDYWEVESDTEHGRAYWVNGLYCSCPDFPRAPSGLCKHKCAVGLIKVNERDRNAENERRERERISDERVAVNFGLAFAGALA